MNPIFDKKHPRKKAARGQLIRITGAIQVGFAVRTYTALHTECAKLQGDKYEVQISSFISKLFCHLTSATSMYRSVLPLSVSASQRLAYQRVSVSRVSILRISVSASRVYQSHVSASRHLSISLIESIE